jgi:hypothetical protein
MYKSKEILNIYFFCFFDSINLLYIVLSINSFLKYIISNSDSETYTFKKKYLYRMRM